MDDSNQKSASKGSSSSSKSKKTGLNVLALIQSARQTYGLRTNDYARYHAHCVCRIQSLHRATSTVSKPPSSNRKSNSNKKGNSSSTSTAFRARTKAIDVAAVQKDERLLELLLWEAERAWAEGLRTREELAALERAQSQSQSQANGSSLSKKRHRSSRRLVKATGHADNLLKLLNDLSASASTNTEIKGVTASSRLQAHIYTLYVSGTHDFVLASSPSATSASTPAKTGSESLSTAYVLLEEFAKASSRATEEALAFELLDELEPMVRFCAYKSEQSKSSESVPDTARRIGTPLLEQKKDMQNVLEDYKKEESDMAKKAASSKKGEQVEAVREIKWRDLQIPVRSAELSTSLGKVQAALSSLEAVSTSANNKSRKSSTKSVNAPVSSTSGTPSARLMAAYDRALSTLSEADERSRKLVDDNTLALSRAHSARFEASSKPLNAAHHWIVFQLLSLRIKRDEALISATLAKLNKREEKRAEKMALTTDNKRKNSRQNTAAGKASRGARVSSNQIPLPIKRKRVKVYPAIIKLLDGILQSLEQIRELNIVEEDSEDLVGLVDGRIANDRARRCFYLAQTYALLDKYPEALSLFQRGSLYIREARSLSSAFDSLSIETLDSEGSIQLGVSNLLISTEFIDQAEKDLTSAQQRAEKDWFLYDYKQQQQSITGESGEQDNSKLVGAVQGMALEGNADKPTTASKVREGPLFFDVAFNYVAGIDIERLQAATRGEVVTMLTTQTVGATAQEEIEKVVDTAMDVVEKAKEVIAPSQPEQAQEAEQQQTKSSGGLWGFFGRKK